MNYFETYYFETSAVNYLFGNLFNDNRFSTVKKKRLQLSKRRKWYISSIVLWEIFLSKNKKRKNQLFDFSRTLFYDYLIPSPEEIIINYINSGLPLIEKKYLLRSKSIFAKEWEKACKDFDYFFAPDENQVAEYTKHLRFIGKYFTKTSKGYSLKSYSDLDSISSKIDSFFLTMCGKKLRMH